MKAMILVAMGGFVPFVLLLFAFLPSPIAVITAYVTGWLFLPVTFYDLWEIFTYNRITAISAMVLVGTLLFDLDRFTRLRFSLVDVPVVVWSVCPFFSSLANDLTAKDGLSESLYQTLTWGMPFLIGRMYFCDRAGIQLLAIGMFVGGLIYVPFCLWEVKMSPQLHYKLYGFLQHSWFQTQRGGGWRPMVFMEHGLMVSLWMAIATLTGGMLWRAKMLERLWGVPMWVLVGVLGVTTVLCKSLGSLVLMVIGVGALIAARSLRSSVPIYVLMIVPVLYVATRATQLWDGQNLVHFIEDNLSPQRAESLEFRFEAEDMLAAHALREPVFGWGGWGRSFVKLHPDDPFSDEMVTVDGLWILHLGKNGFVGLISLTLTVLMPAIVLARRVPPRLWTQPEHCYAGVLALILILYMIDNLVNAMVNPFYMLIGGGLVTFAQGAAALPRTMLQFRPAGAIGRAPARAS